MIRRVPTYCSGPELSEFHATSTIVKIMPKFELKEPLRFIEGTFGPFKPSREAEVPLWLALDLKRRDMCDIYPPEWMHPEQLRQHRDEERALENEFVAMPFHYLEMGKLLLNTNRDYLSADMQVDEIRALLRDIDNQREEKIRHGLPTVRRFVSGIKLNNLTSMEIHTTRPVLTAMFRALRYLSVRPAEEPYDDVRHQLRQAAGGGVGLQDMDAAATAAPDSQLLGDSFLSGAEMAGPRGGMGATQQLLADSAQTMDEDLMTTRAQEPGGQAGPEGSPLVLGLEGDTEAAAFDQPQPPRQSMAPTKKRRTLRDED